MIRTPQLFAFAKAFNNKLFEFFVEVEPFNERGIKSLTIQQSASNITAIDKEMTFEMYIIRDDLPANPIPGNSEVLRNQADELCSITFGDYRGTSGLGEWIEDVRTSITGCSLIVCPASDCTAFFDDPEKMDPSILEYRNCSCDIVLDYNEDDQQFFLYTVSYKGANETQENDVSLFTFGVG